MNVNIGIEDWKNNVMGSLAGIQRAEPSLFLFTRLEGRLAQAVNLTAGQVRWAAVALVVMVAINVAVITQADSSARQEMNDYSLSNFNTY